MGKQIVPCRLYHHQAEVGQLLQLQVDDAMVGVGKQFHDFARSARPMAQFNQDAALPFAANGLHSQLDAASVVNGNLPFVHDLLKFGTKIQKNRMLEYMTNLSVYE